MRQRFLSRAKRRSSTISFLLSLFFFVSTSLIILPTSSTVLAQLNRAELSTESLINYRLSSSGSLDTEIIFSFSNETDEALPIRTVAIHLPYRSMEKLTATFSNKFLPISGKPNSSGTEISVDFENAILRENSRLTLSVKFTLSDYLKSSDSVLTVPSSLPSANVQKVLIDIPDSYVLPVVTSSSMSIVENDFGHRVSITEPTTEEISLIFSEQLIYRFSQKNKLVNSDLVTKTFEIIIPPTDDVQKLVPTYFSEIPDSSSLDQEGNILLKYELSPSESKTVHISGYINRELSNKTEINGSLSPLLTKLDGYWNLSEVNQQTINKDLGLEYPVRWYSLDANDKDYIINTISSYVLSTLDTTEAEAPQLSVYRLGANDLVSGYEQASPQDYVDLTISLLRYYGIPSRQVVGYSADLAKLDSTALTHTWIEYWAPGTGWRILDVYAQEVLSLKHSEISQYDRISLMYRGLSPSFPQYTTYTLNSLEITPSPDLISSITQFSAVAPTVKVSVLEKVPAATIAIENNGSSIIKSVIINNGKSDQLASIEAIIVPGATYDIDLSSSLLDFNKLPGEYKIPIKILAKSTTGETESTTIDINLVISEPWWWNSLVNLLSVLSFIVFLYISWRAFEYLNLKRKSFGK